MDVSAPALEEKKAASPPLLKTDGEARRSHDKAREHEQSDAPPAQTSSWAQNLRHRPWLAATTLLVFLIVIGAGIFW
jgi:hypothetical protein